MRHAEECNRLAKVAEPWLGLGGWHTPPGITHERVLPNDENLQRRAVLHSRALFHSLACCASHAEATIESATLLTYILLALQTIAHCVANPSSSRRPLPSIMPSTDHLRRHVHSHLHHRSHGHAHDARDIQSMPALFHEVSHEDSPIVARADATIAGLSRSLDARDSSDDGSETVINVLLVVLGIAFLALILISVLLLFRRHRRLRSLTQMQPEKGNGLPASQDASKACPKGRGLTIETKHNDGRSSVFFIGRDGQPMLQNPNSPPHSPDNVPEIRITFPEEQDEQGRPRSGRVVVVRVGDNSALGLEPLDEEQLPAYEKDAKEFQSIDMDFIGGLKEKDPGLFQ